jgi:hypothetical protein
MKKLRGDLIAFAAEKIRCHAHDKRGHVIEMR